MPFPNRMMTLVAFLQAQNCSNLPGSWRHPSTMLDFLMPDMNGLDAAYALRRVLPTVPLIFYSAFEDSLSEHTKLIGISEIVSKFDPASLLLEKARSLVYPTAA